MLQRWLPVCLSVCSSMQAGVQGKLQLCAGAPAALLGLAKLWEWLPSLAFFFVVVVCSLIKNCSSSKNKNSVSCVCLSVLYYKVTGNSSYIPCA